RNLARRALVSRFDQLCKIEQGRITEAVQKQKNFNDWLDEFYSRWSATLADVFESIGSEIQIAVDYCQSNKDELVDLTEQVTPEELAAAVAGLIESWSSKPTMLAELIIERECSNAVV
ncbi:MAG: hypothetical protein AAF745_15010, partial [Planctomycetota bacterium]